MKALAAASAETSSEGGSSSARTENSKSPRDKGDKGDKGIIGQKRLAHEGSAAMRVADMVSEGTVLRSQKSELSNFLESVRNDPTMLGDGGRSRSALEFGVDYQKAQSGESITRFSPPPAAHGEDSESESESSETEEEEPDDESASTASSAHPTFHDVRAQAAVVGSRGGLGSRPGPMDRLPSQQNLDASRRGTLHERGTFLAGAGEHDRPGSPPVDAHGKNWAHATQSFQDDSV